MATSFLVVRSSEGEKQENERQYVVWWTKTFKKVQPFSQEKLSSLLQLFLSCLNCLDKNLAGYCILNQGTFRYLFFAILSAVVRNVPSYFNHSPVWYFFQNALNLEINVGTLLPYSVFTSDGSNTILSNIDRTRTSFFEHRTNSNVFIYW